MGSSSFALSPGYEATASYLGPVFQSIYLAQENSAPCLSNSCFVSEYVQDQCHDGRWEVRH